MGATNTLYKYAMELEMKKRSCCRSSIYYFSHVDQNFEQKCTQLIYTYLILMF